MDKLMKFATAVVGGFIVAMLLFFVAGMVLVLLPVILVVLAIMLLAGGGFRVRRIRVNPMQPPPLAADVPASEDVIDVVASEVREERHLPKE